MPDSAADGLRYRQTLTFVTGVLLIAFAVGSASQARLLSLVGEPVADGSTVGVVERLLANLIASAIVIAGLGLVPFWRLHWGIRVAVVLGVGTVGGASRAAVQLLSGVHSTDRLDLLLLDAAAPALTTAICIVVGLIAAENGRRLREQERVNTEQVLRAALALQQLQAEELRVRRSVAEGLHGTLQQHLVIIGAQLAQLIDELTAGTVVTDSHRQRLGTLIDDLDVVREQDVRGYSQLLFPSGADTGLAQAIRILFRRVSAAIGVSVQIDPSVVAADDPGVSALPVQTRIMAIRVLEEGISNALRHGRALNLNAAVFVDDQRVLHMTLDDDGHATVPETPGTWSGLQRLALRLVDYGGGLTLEPRAEGGARLTAWMRLDR